MTYSLVFGILFYATVVKLFSKFSIGVPLCAFLSVTVPFAFDSVVKLILVPVYGMSIDRGDVVELVIQLIAAYAVFRLLDRYEDDIAMWVLTVVGGALTVFIAIPYILLVTPV